MKNSFIYLDNNSTTPIDPAVAKVISDCYSTPYFNPASQHRPGQIARGTLEKSRTAILEMLGARFRGMDTDSLITTSGGTESNNLALFGLTLGAWQKIVLANPSAKRSDYQVIVSAIEHPSVIGTAEELARQGFDVRKLPVDKFGVIRLDVLDEWLLRPSLLVSIMLANNETGVIQPVPKVAEMCRTKQVLMHTDAVQAVGKLPVNFAQTGVDALSFTAHKFCGPRGIGGLILKHGVTLQPTLFGGFQQMARRPGTEDVALMKGMETALRLFADLPSRYEPVARLRDLLESNLCHEIPDAAVIGGGTTRLPNTLNIAFPGVNRQALLMSLDLAGIAVSTGSACASGSSELSPVLLAMGLQNRLIESAVRISLGVTHTESEILEVCRRISSAAKDLRQSNSLGISS